MLQYENASRLFCSYQAVGSAVNFRVFCFLHLLHSRSLIWSTRLNKELLKRWIFPLLKLLIVASHTIKNRWLAFEEGSRCGTLAPQLQEQWEQSEQNRSRVKPTRRRLGSVLNPSLTAAAVAAENIDFTHPIPSQLPRGGGNKNANSTVNDGLTTEVTFPYWSCLFSVKVETTL